MVIMELAGLRIFHEESHPRIKKKPVDANLQFKISKDYFKSYL